VFKEYLVLTSSDHERHVECQDYVINRHARAVLSHRAFQGVFRRYIINRVAQPDTLSPAHLLYSNRPETPMIVEHVCDDAAMFRKALEDEDHKAATKVDEEYIVREFLSGPPIAVEMEEKVIFAEASAGQYRIFDFLRRRTDVSEAAFSAWLDQEGELLAALDEFRSVASRRVHNITSKGAAVYAESGGTGASTGQAYAGIVETWASSLEDLANFYPDMRRRYSDYVDSVASFSVASREHVLITDQD
jgi:hypothetical protein